MISINKYFYNGIALVRGYIKFVFAKLWNWNGVKVGIMPRVFSRAQFIYDRGSNVEVGDRIKVEKDTCLSVRKKGALHIGDNVGIGAYSMIVCHQDISIDDNTIIAPNVMIYDHDHVFSRDGIKHKEFKTSPIKIGKNSWIGANTVILRGTVIGDNCVIGAGSIIKGEVPSNSIVLQKRITEIKNIC